MSETFPIIDLFAGAGGIGLGVQAAGGQLCLSVELDKTCCNTLEQNSNVHPGRVINGDVAAFTGQELRKLAGLSCKDPLVIVGGPPCQPFSKASYWTDPGDDARFRRARAHGMVSEKPEPITEAKLDDRRNLVDLFLDRIIEAHADGFMFENVTSILHPRNKTVVENFIAKAECFGYKCQLIKANAAEYGVPQIRQRVFILGTKNIRPSVPASTHAEIAGMYTDKRPFVTASDALYGLDTDVYYEPEEVVTGKWEKELREIPGGWNYKALTAWAGHENPTFEAETRFWNFLLKLSPDKPSWTIAASPGPWTGPFHWLNRRLRTAEMAALQTFPREYIFTGNRRERVKQIGNAAPPTLVKHMVGEVFNAIEQDVSQRMTEKCIV